MSTSYPRQEWILSWYRTRGWVTPAIRQTTDVRLQFDSCTSFHAIATTLSIDASQREAAKETAVHDIKHRYDRFLTVTSSVTVIFFLSNTRKRTVHDHIHCLYSRSSSPPMLMGMHHCSST